ncbi:MAG: head decoration protein [Gallionella sp.]|nr:head decoration protein [Gallionella sp.]
MPLAVNNIGDNPQIPGIAADAYIPDQLIAGNLKLVSDSIMLTGGAALQRGSVLGRVAFGAIAASTGKTFASGSIAVGALPLAGDTLTLNGTVITFVVANPVGNQVVIGLTTAQTAQNLLAFLLGSSDANLILFTYSLNSSTLTLTAAAIGTVGNALTLATSDAVAFTVSAATLTGGTANTGNATVGTLSAGAQIKPGNYTAVCATATTANVFDPSGNDLGVATFGIQFTNAEISFLITAGGVACAAGDTFAIAAASGSGYYKLAASNAVDGSQNPVAILADYADASAGNVATASYIMGEFNFNALTLGAGMTLASIKAALRPLGIFIKSSVSATDPG